MKKIVSMHLKGYLMILASSVLFATYGVWSKIMGDDFGIFYQGWVRALIVLILLTPFLVWKKAFVRIRTEDYRWFAVLIGFTVFTQAPLYYGYIKTGVGAATLMFYAMSIITSYVVGRFIIGEKITPIKLLSLVLAFGGMALVFNVSLMTFSALGLLMAAANGIASGGEVSSSKKLTNTYSPLVITFYSWVAILITHLPLSLLMGEVQFRPALNLNWAAMLVYAAVSLVSFWIVLEAFRHVDASVGSLMGLSEIVWAMLLGVILFQEHFSAGALWGASLIILAGVLPDALEIIKSRQKLRT